MNKFINKKNKAILKFREQSFNEIVKQVWLNNSSTFVLTDKLLIKQLKQAGYILSQRSEQNWYNIEEKGSK